jgi:DNA methylase
MISEARESRIEPLVGSWALSLQNSADEDPYGSPVTSTRSGAFFSAHPYPTKINADAVVPFIRLHTRPGDVVLDPFAGSGSTGLGTLLVNEADGVMKAQRRAVLYDLSRLSTFISSTLFSHPDPVEFLFLARGGLPNREYQQLVDAYPSGWIDIWRSRDGLHPFPDTVEALSVGGKPSSFRGYRSP